MEPPAPEGRGDVHWSRSRAGVAAGIMLMILASIGVAMSRHRPLDATDAHVRININTAGLDQLERLPGIGATLAARIIDERTSQGRFQNVDDLERVRGIGPRTLDRLRDFIRAD